MSGTASGQVLEEAGRATGVGRDAVGAKTLDVARVAGEHPPADDDRVHRRPNMDLVANRDTVRRARVHHRRRAGHRGEVGAGRDAPESDLVTALDPAAGHVFRHCYSCGGRCRRRRRTCS